MKRTASLGKTLEIIQFAVICGCMSTPLHSLFYHLGFGALEYSTFPLTAPRGRQIF